MNSETISSHFPFPSNYIEIDGSKMHYIEQGKGAPILFLHGIPTSSYLWRNVLPHLTQLGRCIAPDLIGMGKSDKPNIDYSIFDHIKYINKFIKALDLRRITLVTHGWGSIIGLHYAMENENNCKGIVIYEGHLRPLNGCDLSLPFQEQLNSFQNYEQMSDLVLNSSYFVDKVLNQGMIRALSDQELDYYRGPFSKEGAGRPLYQYMRELTAKENRNKIDKLIEGYSKKLMKSKMPKLLLYSIPGFITTISTVMWAKEHLPKLEMVDVGESLHYAQESNPVLMGEAISIWLQGIEQQLPTG